VGNFMMCERHFSGSEGMEVLEIHHNPQLLDQCCDMLNMEWPRSKTLRYSYSVCLCLAYFAMVVSK
jgi:hypothetical protein